MHNTIHKYIFIFLTLTFLSSCYLTRAIRYRKFELKDIDNFKHATLKPSATPYYYAENTGQYPEVQAYLDSTLTNTETYSFLVIKNDTIVYEKYFGEVNRQKQVTSFSVAKSFVSTLVAIALEEGYIKSLSEPITNYIPELLKSDKGFATVTIQHVLDMRSGVKSSEDYGNPGSDVLKLGFTNHIMPIIKKLKLEKNPGELEYKSVNTQLLGIIVERATGKRLFEYMQEKIWSPLGMESEATWNIDHKKDSLVRAFCCLNATTRDFAKLGSLFLHNGYWNGQQIISEKWVQNSTNADTMATYEGYKNQWWGYMLFKANRDSLKAIEEFKKIPHRENRMSVVKSKDGNTYYVVRHYSSEYYAEGILGQFIYVNPEKNIVIVRTGHYWKNKKYRSVESLMHFVAENKF